MGRHGKALVTSRQSIGGFTLIELLISLSIMTMVMVIGVTAYSLLAESWTKQRGQFDEKLGQLKAFDLVVEALQSTRPYYITSADDPAFYFLGDQKGFTAVTEKSVLAPQKLAVFRILRESTADGKEQLVYEEAALSQPLVALEQELPFNYRKVLVRDLNRVEFSYYGWESNRAQMNRYETGVNPPRWFREYDGAQRKNHPTQVKVSTDKLSWSFSIPDWSLELLLRQSGEVD